MNQTWLGLMIIVCGTFIVQGLYFEVSPFFILGYIVGTILLFVSIDYFASKIWKKIRRTN